MSKEIIRNSVLLIAMIMSVTVTQGVVAENQDIKVNVKKDGKANESSAERTQKSICKKVAALLKKNKIAEYMPERRDFDPNGSEYLNIDIDGDGKADKIIVSTGAAESLLAVHLSTGGEYDVEVSGFITIIRFEDNIYAVVTYREWNAAKDNDKIIGYRLYKLTKDTAIIVCDNF
jgi:hypothetical protein